jgi:hypothetical protein
MFRNPAAASLAEGHVHTDSGDLQRLICELRQDFAICDKTAFSLCANRCSAP